MNAGQTAQHEMSEAAAVDGYDRERYLKLLQEYTQKLKDAVSRASGAKSMSMTRFVASSLFVAIAAGLIGIVLSFRWPYETVWSYVALIGSATVLAGAIIFNLTVERSDWKLAYGVAVRRSLDNDEAHVLFAVLDRLIRLGSSRAEHADLGFDERLEFELRLAEAEAVLRLAGRLLAKSPADEERLHALRNESETLRTRLSRVSESRTDHVITAPTTPPAATAAS